MSHTGNIQPRTHIQFGFGTKLVSEDWYVHELGGVMGKRGFRALCSNLGVPMIQFGSTMYVDQVRFQLAMTAVMRIGEPDFYTPGSYQVTNNRREATTLDSERFQKNYRIIAGELILSKKLEGQGLTRKVRSSLKEAARRMASASLQLLPSQEQKKFALKAKRELKEGESLYA